MRSTVALKAEEKGNIAIDADMLITFKLISTSFSQQVKARIAVIISSKFRVIEDITWSRGDTNFIFEC